jgi:galactose mutarotase-like enzyme
VRRRARGPLIPWPNRLRDGHYGFDGADYQAALTEPDKHNAIHGLLRRRPCQLTRHDPDRVTLATTLHPMQGYPFTLDVQIGGWTRPIRSSRSTPPTLARPTGAAVAWASNR